jgi:hypothetical protein
LPTDAWLHSTICLFRRIATLLTVSPRTVFTVSHSNIHSLVSAVRSSLTGRWSRTRTFALAIARWLLLAGALHRIRTSLDFLWANDGQTI